jgi:hypothetical protein
VNSLQQRPCRIISCSHDREYKSEKYFAGVENRSFRMYLMYTLDGAGKRIYTLKVPRLYLSADI